MAMKKNEKIMLGLVGAALIYMVIDDPYYIIWKDKPVPGADAATQQAGTQPGDAAAIGAAGIAGGDPGQATWDRVNYEVWGRDPFVQTRKHVDTAAELSKMKLGAIAVNGEDRMALINSKPVREGDLIGGMTVERIEKDKVILSVQGLSYTLSWED